MINEKSTFSIQTWIYIFDICIHAVFLILHCVFRMNLDPRESFTDAEIWQALETAQLKSLIQQLPQKLGMTHWGSKRGKGGRREG